MAKGCRIFADLCTLGVLFSFVCIGFYFTIKHANEKYDAGVYIPVILPQSPNYNEIRDYLVNQNVSTAQTLSESDTPQQLALKWIADVDEKALDVEDFNIIQRYILTVLYYATTGHEWNEHYGHVTEVGECDWFGIECNSNLTVTGISLSSNNLVGTVPLYEIASLPLLTTLDLSTNSLEGPIPDKFYENTLYLEVLDLSNNSMGGTISSLITNRENMTSLHLSNNHFSGTIPDKIDSMKNLIHLGMNANELKGAVPDLFRLTKLEVLLLGDNKLNGTLPDLMWNRKLKMLDLFANEFTGSIPKNYGNLRSLTRLQFAGNSLVGVIPSEIDKIKALEYLTLQFNNFTGEIPTGICEISTLRVLEADCDCTTGPSISCSCCTSCCCHSTDTDEYHCEETSQA